MPANSENNIKDPLEEQVREILIKNGVGCDKLTSASGERFYRLNPFGDQATQAILALLTEAREIFIPIRSYEGLYEVSNTGKIRSVKGGRRSGKELVQAGRSRDAKYRGVSLCSKGECKSYAVHRLVAFAFLANPDHKPCINHKDGNTSNNNVENLEWVTYSENEKHSHEVLGKQIWNKGKIAWETIACAVCGKEITSRVWELRKYCSRKCVDLGKVKELKNE